MDNKKETIIKSKTEAIYTVLRVVLLLFIIYLGVVTSRLIWFIVQDNSIFRAEFFHLHTNDSIGFIGVAGKYGISLKNTIPTYFVENSKKVYVLWIVLELGGNVILGYFLLEIVRIFREIVATGRPYSADIILRNRKIAIGIAIFGLYKKAVVPAVFWMAGIAKWDIQLLDPFTLLIAGMIFCLSYVFEYGMELQKESDETL